MLLRLIFLLFLSVLFSNPLFCDVKIKTPIKIGIYQNYPKIYFDENKTPSGIFVEVLQEITKSENWEINYIPCQWSDCLEQLETGQLDIMPDVAHTIEREKKFLFSNEAFLSSWSVLYKRKNVKIDSILDLQSKRVAVVSESIQLSAIKQELLLFNIQANIQEYKSFDKAFKEVQNNNADCVITNRFYGDRHYKTYKLEKTAILLKPSMIKFAFFKNNTKLKSVIDNYLKKYKQDKESIYYKSLEKLTREQNTDFIPKWLYVVIFILVLGLVGSFFVVMIFKKMVTKKSQELMKTSSKLNYLSKYDELTGLLNRTVFIDRLEHSVNIAKRKNTNILVIYFDLDNFHELNNTLGNDVGDKVLQYFANGLKSDFREYDTLSRLSSDEFIVMIESEVLDTMLLRVIEDLENLFQYPVVINDRNIHLTFSAGIAIFPQDAKDATELISKSNLALNTAKSLGRNNFQFYTENMTKKMYEKLSLVTNLKESVEDEKLEVYFQPKVSALNGEIIGAEALLRWTDTEHGVVSPAIFIPLAEEHGLINKLGHFVLEESIKQYSEWIKQGLKPGVIAVNVSVLQLKSVNFIPNLKSLIETYNFDVNNLEIELTETQLMTKADQAIEVLQEISDLGIKIAIDDFGTGYSSLNYLRRLPVNVLKIDYSFIKEIPFDSNDMEVTKAIIAIAKSLKLSTVAEGVETKEQLEFLQENGCDVIQGYYFYKPMRANQMEYILYENT